jgi:16S rRNA (cytosine1402-N4)-methyltransferase
MIATLSPSIFTPRPKRARNHNSAMPPGPRAGGGARSQLWLGGGEETAYAWRDQSGTVAEMGAVATAPTTLASSAQNNKTNHEDRAPHTPVMLEACLEAFEGVPAGWIVDATFGAGGHSRALLQAGHRVLAIDQDPGARVHAERIEAELASAGTADPRDHFRFVSGNFRNLRSLCEAAQVRDVAGVLLDLGVSSMQLDEGERGFSFRHPGPLDMRMGASGRSAADLVQNESMESLAAILHRFGEERHSRRLARAIVDARAQAPITTTDALARVIESAYPGRSNREHPARRTFQALRIAVNDELGALTEALEEAATLLQPGGRLAVLAYHSLEDRIVKQTILRRHDLTAAFRKPREASEAETARNPRARSAKLRVATKRPLQGDA